MTHWLRQFSLEGRVALLTGAARGLGFEIARALAGSGAHVVLNGRDERALEEAASRIREEGGVASTSAFDITKPDEVRDAVGRLAVVDILVNAAGRRNRKGLASFEDDEIRAMVDANLVGTLGVCREVLKGMVRRRSGRVVTVTSIVGGHAAPPGGDPLYTATKSALEGLVRALAVEFGPHGITSNGIAPGFFITEANRALHEAQQRGEFPGRTALNRWGRVDEIGGAAVFLASDAASYVNGHVLVVDGGTTILI